MKAKILFISTLVVLTSPFIRAQQQPHDPLAEFLFPPDLIMMHQKAIGLTEPQRTFVKGEMQKTQTRFTDLQWQLQADMESMASLLKEEKAEEQQVLSQLEKVLNLEREIKRSQMSLIIRIKNQLSAEQQAQLRKIRDENRLLEQRKTEDQLQQMRKR